MGYTLNKKKLRNALRKRKHHKTLRLKNKNSISTHKRGGKARIKSKNYYGGLREGTPTVAGGEENIPMVELGNRGLEGPVEALGQEEVVETSPPGSSMMPVEPVAAESVAEPAPVDPSLVQESQPSPEVLPVLPSSSETSAQRLETGMPIPESAQTSSSMRPEVPGFGSLASESSGVVAEEPSPWVDTSRNPFVELPVERQLRDPSYERTLSFEREFDDEDTPSSEEVVEPQSAYDPSLEITDDPLEESTENRKGILGDVSTELPPSSEETSESIFSKQPTPSQSTSENDKFITIRIAVPSGIVDLQGNASNTFEQTIGSILGKATSSQTSSSPPIEALNDKIDKLYQLVNDLASKINV